MSKKIHIIEDETPIVKLLTNKLERKGYTVSTASNGKIGLTIALKEHPDLILLDLVMPKMDGITMLKELRKDKWGETVKVIILTNLPSKIKNNEAIELGTHDYLIKTNWELDELVAKILKKIK